MIEVVVFEPWHIDVIDLREMDRLSIGGIEYRDMIKDQAKRGMALTGFFGTDVVAIIGLIPFWSGVADAWAVTSPLVDKMKLSFHRAVCKGFKEVLECNNLHRVQAAVHVKHVQSQKWLKALGFVDEGLMRKYGPDGGDYHRYARVI